MLVAQDEPEGQASFIPQRQCGVMPVVSHHSLAAQQVLPQRGPAGHPPEGAQLMTPPSPSGGWQR
jgi:hypothetical protein